jgi:hypothetical protein
MEGESKRAKMKNLTDADCVFPFLRTTGVGQIRWKLWSTSLVSNLLMSALPRTNQFGATADNEMRGLNSAAPYVAETGVWNSTQNGHQSVNLD